MIIADNTEPTEAIIPADMLRRANINVTIAGLKGEDVVEGESPTKIKIKPDTALETVKNNVYDAIIIPGGDKGAKDVAADKTAIDVVRRHANNGAIIAAICHGPLVLTRNDIGKGKNITSYPACKDEIEKAGFHYTGQRVAVDGTFITSQTPGTAFEWSLEIVKALVGPAEVAKLQETMLIQA